MSDALIADEGLVDLHTHVLPGVDDGAEDWKTAVEMCRGALQDGIGTMVATPHFERGLFPTLERGPLHELLDELRGRCREALGDRLTLYLGSDCHLHPEILANLESHRIPTLNDSRYFLLEFPGDALPPDPHELVFQMKLAGYIPIVTHPERSEVLAARPGILYEMARCGALAQVTAGSLTGQFGRRARAAAEVMLESHLVQVIASDAHDPEHRRAQLTPGRDAAAEIVGEDLAGRMVRDIPWAILHDEPFDFPEATAPGSGRHRGRSRTPFRGFLERFFSR